jgi:hypothetical protein
MRDHIKNSLILILFSIIAAGVGYTLGFVRALDWVIVTAKDHFDLNFSINHYEMAQAIFRYKNMIG